MHSKSWVVQGCGVVLALALGGCASGGRVGPTLAALPEPAAVPAAPPPVNYGAFLAGPAGTRLPEADRAVALAAENDAIASGQRRTWKGAKGVYGFVEPGPANPTAATADAETAPSQCRSFTSTIYFAGRPQTGKGSGCRDADGAWHVTS